MWTTRYVMRGPAKAIVKKDWTLAFCGEIKRRGLKFTWQLPSGTRSEAMDAETLKARPRAAA
jgi:hypothetical protein